MLSISGIQDGYVIDHIPAGKSMDIYNYLKLDELDCQVAIIKNASSSKMNKKDIIKIQADIPINLDILGFVSKDITVNVIRDGQIAEKKTLDYPKKIVNVIKCKNPRCITSIEQELPHVFTLTDQSTHTYRCIYCEEKFK
jgi:aspartate carbamoyltransferase regulatory subunit